MQRRVCEGVGRLGCLCQTPGAQAWAVYAHISFLLETAGSLRHALLMAVTEAPPHKHITSVCLCNLHQNHAGQCKAHGQASNQSGRGSRGEFLLNNHRDYYSQLSFYINSYLSHTENTLIHIPRPSKASSNHGLRIKIQYFMIYIRFECGSP